MAIKDFIRPPTGELQAPKLVSYGDALSPISDHIDKLVQARDKKREAQAERDFQVARENERMKHDSKMQQDRFVQEEKMAEVENGYQVARDNASFGQEEKMAGINHTNDLELENVKTANNIKELGVKGSIKRQNTVHEYKVKNAYNIAGENRVKARRAEEENRQLNAIVKSLGSNDNVVYHKTDEEKSNEIDANVKASSAPMISSINNERAGTLSKVAKSAGVSSKDIEANIDSVSKSMKALELTSKDFKMIDKDHGKYYTNTNVFKKQLDLEEERNGISAEMKKLERDGEGIGNEDYDSLSAKKEALDSKLGAFKNLSSHEGFLVATIADTYNAINSKYDSKVDTVTKEQYAKNGIPDPEKMSRSNNKVVDLQGTLDNYKTTINTMVKNGATAQDITPLINEYKSFEKIKINSDQKLKATAVKGDKAITKEKVSNIKQETEFARNELKSLNTAWAKGKISKEDYEEKSKSAKDKIRELNKELKALDKE